MEKKHDKFYLVANKKTGKYYKVNTCFMHGEFGIKLNSVSIEDATIFKKKEDARRTFNYIEDKRVFKQILEGTITVAEISYEINYL
jgi:hypothetical protein